MLCVRAPAKKIIWKLLQGTAWTRFGGRPDKNLGGASNVSPPTADEKAVNSPTQKTATLKTTASDSPQSIPCLFETFEGKRLILHFEKQPMVSGPVSVEYNDALFLGEIIRFSAAGMGAWQVEILVDQVLTGLQSLLRFRAQLLGEGAGRAPERASHPVYA